MGQSRAWFLEITNRSEAGWLPNSADELSNSPIFQISRSCAKALPASINDSATTAKAHRNILCLLQVTRWVNQFSFSSPPPSGANTQKILFILLNHVNRVKHTLGMHHVY